MANGGRYCVDLLIDNNWKTVVSESTMRNAVTAALYRYKENSNIPVRVREVRGKIVLNIATIEE